MQIRNRWLRLHECQGFPRARFRHPEPILRQPMQRTAPCSAMVLIVAPDDAVRMTASVALRRAGFVVRTARDAKRAALLLERENVHIIVRDANIVVGTELSSRTVILAAEHEREQPHVFAVIETPADKPLDAGELVRVVSACADESPEVASPEEGAAAAAPLDIRVLQRFVANVPGLRKLLAGVAASPDELLLRHEMRRTIGRLSEAFDEAARIEPSHTRAAAYLEASEIAASLAARPAAATSTRDH